MHAIVYTRELQRMNLQHSLDMDLIKRQLNLVVRIRGRSLIESNLTSSKLHFFNT